MRRSWLKSFEEGWAGDGRGADTYSICYTLKLLCFPVKILIGDFTGKRGMTPLSEQQRLFYVETTQLYEAWRDARRQAEVHKYGMKWVTAKGRQYLVKLTNARGNGKSLGPRTPETEALLAAFQEGKLRADRRLGHIRERLEQQARLNRALRMGRLPSLVAAILGAIDRSAARDDFRVVGTHALYAYEALAGVQIRMELLASGDVDLLYDPRKRLALVARHLDGGGLLGLLRRVDKTFEPLGARAFRAVNDQGFMVDLVAPLVDARLETALGFCPDDLQAAEIVGLEWLVNAPATEAVVLAMDGMPVRFLVPDPRAFAYHKAWIARQPDREPVKKGRDLAQARLLFSLLKTYLPNYPLEPEAVRYLPRAVIAGAADLVDEVDQSLRKGDFGG